MNELWSRMLSAWDNLSLRERTLLSAMGGVLVVFLLALVIVNPLLGALDRGSQRIDSAEQKLGFLRFEYHDVEPLRGGAVVLSVDVKTE